MILALILELAGIIVIFTDESLVKENAEKTWNSASTDAQDQFKADNDCSDFDDCWEIIKSEIDSNMFIVGGIVIGVFVYQLLMTIFAFCLCCKIGKGEATLDNDV